MEESRLLGIRQFEITSKIAHLPSSDVREIKMAEHLVARRLASPSSRRRVSYFPLGCSCNDVRKSQQANADRSEKRASRHKEKRKHPQTSLDFRRVESCIRKVSSG